MRACLEGPPTAGGVACVHDCWPRAGRKTAAVLLALLLLSSTFVSRRASAQSTPPSQYDIQSVYLFDFAKFVRWPARAENDVLTLCVAGQQIYVDTLTKIVAGERIENHPLAVRPVERPADESGCGILFIGASAQENLDNLLAGVAGKPVLTVSDIPGFLERGGMIQFLVINNRVRFSIDLRPMQKSGISLSSELLRVAVSVNGGTAEGGPS